MTDRMQWRYDIDEMRIYRGDTPMFAVCAEVLHNDHWRELNAMACDAVAALNELHADRVEELRAQVAQLEDQAERAVTGCETLRAEIEQLRQDAERVAEEALLRQALEALELSVQLLPDAFGAKRSNAIIALRKRLKA